MPFRFENVWLLHHTFRNNFKKWWQEAQVYGWEGYKFMKKLDLLKQCIKGWNKEIFGNVKEEKQRLHTRLLELDLIEGEGRLNWERRKERCETKQQLEYMVFKEEVMWRQKAKVQWVKEGDCNSKIFHQI